MFRIEKLISIDLAAPRRSAVAIAHARISGFRAKLTAGARKPVPDKSQRPFEGRRTEG
jgi:hypothetical protein